MDGVLVAFTVPFRGDAELDAADSTLIDLAWRDLSPRVSLRSLWHGDDTWICMAHDVTASDLNIIATRVGQAIIGRAVTWLFDCHRIASGVRQFVLGPAVTPPPAGTT